MALTIAEYEKYQAEIKNLKEIIIEAELLIENRNYQLQGKLLSEVKRDKEGFILCPECNKKAIVKGAPGFNDNYVHLKCPFGHIWKFEGCQLGDKVE